MPNQYAQDDDGLLHALGVQEQLDAIIASPALIADHLRRTAALMSESGGDFDAAVLIAAADLLSPTAASEAGWVLVPRKPTEAMREALAELSAAMKTLIHEGIDRGKGHWPAWDHAARAVDRAYAAMLSAATLSSKQGGE